MLLLVVVGDGVVDSARLLEVDGGSPDVVLGLVLVSVLQDPLALVLLVAKIPVDGEVVADILALEKPMSA